MDYLFSRVFDVAMDLKKDTHPLRRAFGVHLEKVSQALHDIEWVNSGDKTHPQELPAIEAVLYGDDE